MRVPRREDPQILVDQVVHIMQELVLLISSLAGAASAVAVHKMPRGARMPTIGASRRVRSEIASLENERDLLEKAVARLYDGSGLPESKRGALLEKYQERLSEVRARIEGLEAAGAHPDLGPVGEGLMTLMDQKLSSLDARLRDMSAKMQAPRPEKARDEKRPEPRPRAEPKARAPEPPAPDKSKELDMVTLTVHPAGAAAAFAAPAPAEAAQLQEAAAEIEPAVEPAQVPSVSPVQEPAVPDAAQVPDSSPVQEPAEAAQAAEPPAPDAGPKAAGQDALDEYDDENLEDLKKDILKALDKIEQAEVE